ncbi:MAG: tetratricopeptide repeat protein [Symploca sp. SIO2G7]|nr:tetratricopeptide repeat protein [Symploca sp. SIO2G7]
MHKQSWYARQKARLLHRRGCTLARQGNHKSAIAAFSNALIHHPNVADVYVTRGLSYRALGQLDDARQDFMAAIDHGESPAAAYFQRGQLAAEQGHFEEAINDWQQAITLNPNYAKAHYQLALAYRKAASFPAALASLNRVLEINPNWATAYLERGHLRRHLDDWEGAMADWQLAMLNDPSLASRVPAAAQTDAFASVKKLLQEALHPFGVTVKKHDTTLEISLRRQVGEGVNYFRLPDQIRTLLLPLELSEITTFTLVGYVSNVRGPEWKKNYDLYKDQPCPPCHWPTALAALVTFPPMGVTALVYASQVKRFYQRGQYPDALRASKAVRRLSLVGTGAMCLLASLPLGYTAVTSIQNEPTPPVKTARAIDYKLYSN